MRRSFEDLRNGPFDLLVIGGGIYGAWTALDASLRGLKVALVDKGDWGGGTSSASSKLLHGGLRYLEQFRFGLVRKALRERALLATLAPHRVRPARFIVPLFEDNRAGPFLLKSGITLYGLLSRGDSPGGETIRLGTGEAKSAFPFLKPDGLQGAVSYGDCITDDARFTLEIVEAAVGAGATAVNYALARGALTGKDRISGAVVEDVVAGGKIEVHASVVVNTAGPWVTGMEECRSLAGEVRLTKGVHLVFPPLPSPDAFLSLTRRDGRVLFFIPWYGRTLVGTTDTDYHGHPDEVRVDEEDVEYLLEEIGHVLKKGIWKSSSILGMSAGLRALVDEPGKPPAALTREWRLKEPQKRLFVSLGGKLTSARADGAVIVDRVMKALGRPVRGRAPTEKHPLPRSPGRPFAAWQEEARARGAACGLDEETALWCSLRYGTSSEKIHTLVREQPSLSGRIHREHPFCLAEAFFGASEEMAVHLTDLLRRRIPLMLLARADRGLLEKVADLAAPILKWSGDRRLAEIERSMKIWEQRPHTVKGSA